VITIWDFQKVEKKWQKKWDKTKVFETDIDKKARKFFINVPYPYVNAAPHIGHSYTYFRTDVIARFKRMMGFNVLYPQGFHATGEPILGAIERLRKGDKIQIETMKQSGAKDSDIERFKKEPRYLIDFFIKKWLGGFKLGGFSIDWRRMFITTTLTPTYSRFVEWQYNTLKKKGYVTQGTHPVVWCPKCKSPTGDHDRLEGEGETIKDFMWVKFKLKDSDLILMAGTTRPDALFGQTNLWIDPEGDYVIVKVGKEKWVVGRASLEKIGDHYGKPEILGTIKPEELVGKWVKGPLVDFEIYILPAVFIDSKVGSGIIYSALETPQDYMEIKRYHEHPELIKKYNLEKDVVLSIVPIPNISVEGMEEDLGRGICKEFGANSYRDTEALDKAKDEINKRVFRKGIMRENCSKYSGQTVRVAQEKMKIDMIKSNDGVMFYELSDKVVCRCTTECTVKILKNQWFLKFSDERWKNLVRKCLSGMIIYPDEARNNFEKTIEWLHDKACTRRTGLGTPLPWDKEWIVETLSDSTIYMAYYTISRIISENKISADKLTDEIFDFIFLGKGKIDVLSKKSKISRKLLKSMKTEFEYFYPFDMRISAKDLLQNHLTFSLFHHTALWPEKYWPRGFGLNGYVHVEGKKMSKSSGNMVPLSELIKKYGADLTRINIVSSGEDLTDADWRAENLKSFRIRLELLFDTIKNLKKAKGKDAGNAGLYLQSKLQKNIKAATEHFEELRFRSGLNYAMFDMMNDLKWYLKSVDGIKNANRKIMEDFLSKTVRLLAPFTPHICEEMWSKLGNKKMISFAPWPDFDQKLINVESEICEDMIRQTINDIEEIKKITKKKPKAIHIFVAENWKFRVYNKVLRGKDKDMNQITKEIMSTDARTYGKATVSFIQSLYKNLKGLKAVIPRSKQMEILKGAKPFLEKELGSKIIIADAERTTNTKAKISTPNKFGIFIE